MLETARDQAFPRIQQISFFLPNKVGSLQRVLHSLAEKSIRVCGIAILDSHDHAVVRIVVDKPDKATEILGASGRAICTTQLLGIELPDEDPRGVSNLLGRLVSAEINVFFAYPLLVRHRGAAVLVVATDHLESAATVVKNGGFSLVEQNDLFKLGDSR